MIINKKVKFIDQLDFVDCHCCLATEVGKQDFDYVIIEFMCRYAQNTNPSFVITEKMKLFS